MVECLHETVFQSMEHCSPIKTNERLTHATSWDELEILWEKTVTNHSQCLQRKSRFLGPGKEERGVISGYLLLCGEGSDYNVLIRLGMWLGWSSACKHA